VETTASSIRSQLGSGFVREVAVGAGSLLGLAIGPAGRILACDKVQRSVIEYAPDLSMSVFFQGTPDQRLQTPNGIAVDEAGTVFVSDSGTSGQDNGTIFQIAPSGRGRVWSLGAPRQAR
jgi:sugar lactone lactonase YvrE